MKYDTKYNIYFLVCAHTILGVTFWARMLGEREVSLALGESLEPCNRISDKQNNWSRPLMGIIRGLLIVRHHE